MNETKRIQGTLQQQSPQMFYQYDHYHGFSYQYGGVLLQAPLTVTCNICISFYLCCTYLIFSHKVEEVVVIVWVFNKT